MEIRKRTKQEQDAAARDFAKYWEGKGYEKGESQVFWLSLLRDVLGVERPETVISFEDQVHLDHTAFIDGMVQETHVMIEQKSVDKDLMKPIRQSDGTLLTPFQQAKRYSSELPYSQRPRWIIVCNFQTFHIYDMERPGGDPEVLELKDMGKEYYRLSFLIRVGDEHIRREMEMSLKAGELVGVIHDRFLEQYHDPMAKRTQNSLNILCVRLVFCMYAEDAGLFGPKDAFSRYIAQYEPKDIRQALLALFKVLDTPTEERDEYLDDELAAFPYCNGGLFENENIVIPKITQEIKDSLLDASQFDWSEISPVIFGAVFESTLNPEARRAGGMHYTSVENIHKLIDPLFLDDLKRELEDIEKDAVVRTRERKLNTFQQKLAGLRFFDPACGSGNFLTETYICIRRLENRAIYVRQAGQMVFGDQKNPVMVSISQFYGIEINDFAVTVAKTALWIAESQMLKETEEIVSQQLDFLPLKTNANITEGNALRLDWRAVTRNENLSYIIGNPPFLGARVMSKAQKDDLLNVFGASWAGLGDLDYVCGWYKKASDMMTDTQTRAAFVSTNSITQGGAVTNLWKPLFKDGNHIDYAYRTFSWDSEATAKAHVHCVIVGFSKTPYRKDKLLFTNGRSTVATNINGYLLDAEDIFIEKRMEPISDVPTIALGGQAIDDGNFILTREERDELLEHEPQAAPFLRQYMMGKDFIERTSRYCIWLVDADLSLLRKCPEILKRIENVKEFRSNSRRTSTLKAAEKPMLFASILECDSDYVALPKVSSQNRRYIPIDYLPASVIPGDKLFVMQHSTLYHFGVMTSNVHMSWMRAVCGRLKSDYSYSNTIVYNNFPWPSPTPEQRQRIEQTAQAILDARAAHPGCSLADLYDDLVMPGDLRKAHQANDIAVMTAYGFVKGTPEYQSESACVAALMRMYQALTE